MIVLYILVLLYLLMGAVLWNVGLKEFGGKQAYIEYLESIGSHASAYFFCVIIFVCSWPLFLKKHEKGEDNEN